MSHIIPSTPEKKDRVEPHDSNALPQITLFKDDKLRGDSWTMYGSVPYVGNDCNDVCSSILVVNGVWQCYINANYDDPTGGPIGPGEYLVLADYGIANDAISSVKFLHY